ncbi:unnamed protein product [Lymnaea stagnalis]|uniref:ZP domain-containing protein n=1 Tax=Lymnaea stagnalis TaxID=6523 RepID=A0AAV2HX03_LYMST
MARPFLITPVIKVKVFWTVAIVLISWSALCQGQEPRVDCSDGRDDLILRFPNSDFPGFNQNNLRVAFQPEVTDNCNPTAITHTSNLEFYIIIPHDNCSTTSYYAVNNRVMQKCYENQVEYNEYNTTIKKFQIRSYPIVCCKNINYTAPVILRKAKLVQTFDFQAEINFYQDETLAARIDANPYSVSIGDWVVVGINVKAESPTLFADGDLKLVITKCTLDPTGHPDVSKSILIINDNCPVDATILSTHSVNATTESFRLKVYKWFGYSAVYVSCHVRLCLASSPDPICDKSCPKSRRRRHISYTKHVTSGPSQTVSKAFILKDSD